MSEFQVNMATRGSQGMPEVSMNESGQVIVGWTLYSHYRVPYIRLFDSNDKPTTDDIIVASGRRLQRNLAGVAIDSSGRSVVLYSEQAGEGHPVKYLVRFFLGDGSPVDSPIEVCGPTAQTEVRGCTLDVSPDGRFMVTWVDWNNNQREHHVRAARYSPDGQLETQLDVAGPLTYNDYGWILYPRVDVNSNENASVAWVAARHPEADLIMSRAYDANNNPVSAMTTVESIPRNGYTGVSYLDVVTTSRRETVCVWLQEHDDEGDNTDHVYVRALDSNGTVSGVTAKITDGSPDERKNRVRATCGGEDDKLLLSWGHDNREDVYGVLVEIDRSGRDLSLVPHGHEFRVNDYQYEDQAFPAVDATSNGDAFAVWSSWQQDGNMLGIYGRRYQILL